MLLFTSSSSCRQHNRTNYEQTLISHVSSVWPQEEDEEDWRKYLTAPVEAEEAPKEWRQRVVLPDPKHDDRTLSFCPAQVRVRVRVRVQIGTMIGCSAPFPPWVTARGLQPDP